MRPQSPDTPPEIEEMILERYRRMSLGEKRRIVEDLNRTALACPKGAKRAIHRSLRSIPPPASHPKARECLVPRSVRDPQGS